MRVSVQYVLAVFLVAAITGLTISPAVAHAFKVRFDLPLPLSFYLYGAGAVVLFSFIIAARFLKPQSEFGRYKSFDLNTSRVTAWIASAPVLAAVRLCSVGLFILVLTTGFFGQNETLENFAPTFVWIVFWVGMAFISSLIGDLWAVANPWKIIAGWAGKLMGSRPSPRPYPQWLGHWPATVMFILFAWFELVYEHGEQPRSIANLTLVYSVYIWLGMICFGGTVWLKHGEIFTVVFGLLGKFAPFAYIDNRLVLRPPAAGLLSEKPVLVSYICFVLVFLTTVTFDGILETPFWANIFEQIAEGQVLGDASALAQLIGIDLGVLIKTLVLLSLPLMSIAVYFIFSHAISMFGSGGRISTPVIAGYFVLTLVPIAIAYHLSHYLSYLLIGGQYIIPMASDPFGLGWDMFGTTDYRVDINIINAKFVWYFSVVAIVLGHIIAVYLAHLMAMWVFADRGPALRSQIPMIALMIGYTMLSLWILSQPIVS